MYRANRVGRSMKVLILAVIVAILFIYRERQVQRALALEAARERTQAGQALVRYVQLRRRCSEEAAYERIAAFVKNHTTLAEHPVIDRLLTNDRQRLLELAQNILRRYPDEIDEI